MKFSFVCPHSHTVFETDAFTIVENRGVITDAEGNRRLDAKVALDHPCPLCGQRHLFRADELVCPFGG
jgi:Zn finger protein HypA/HybF involved in hydrogenase expression